MSDPYVTSATIVDGNLQLSVLVNEFKSGEWVEISGQATQTDGAFAPFYDVKQVPAKPNGDPKNPKDKNNSYVYVTGTPTPHQFRKNQDVSVVARVARVWLTVLGGEYEQDPDPTASDGMTWTEIRVAMLNGGGAWSKPA